MRNSSEDPGSATAEPSELAGVSADSVIAFVQYAGGREILSRYADPVWDLSPYCQTANTARSEKLIRWSKLPSSFVSAVKLILYRYWMVGRPGGIRPTATTVILTFYAMARFLRWVNSVGGQHLTDISPLHCMGWVQHCRERKLAPRSQKVHYRAVETLYMFRNSSGEEAGISAASIHNTYPDIADAIRAKARRSARSVMEDIQQDRKRLRELLREARERVRGAERDLVRIASENARLVTENAVLKAKLTSRNTVELPMTGSGAFRLHDRWSSGPATNLSSDAVSAGLLPRWRSVLYRKATTPSCIPIDSGRLAKNERRAGGR